jgi:hypothetical protein
MTPHLRGASWVSFTITAPHLAMANTEKHKKRVQKESIIHLVIDGYRAERYAAMRATAASHGLSILFAGD